MYGLFLLKFECLILIYFYLKWKSEHRSNIYSTKLNMPGIGLAPRLAGLEKPTGMLLNSVALPNRVVHLTADWECLS